MDNEQQGSQPAKGFDNLIVIVDTCYNRNAAANPQYKQTKNIVDPISLTTVRFVDSDHAY